MITEIRPVNNLYLKWIDNTMCWGGFTETPIKKGDLVERCYCVIDDFNNVEKSLLKDYVFTPDNSNDAYHCLGFGAIYNHSYEPNMYWRKIENEFIIEFIALRDIEIGEELTQNYGENYWKIRKEKKII